MHRFHLELLLHIIGLGSASGIFYSNGSLYLISDNAGYLYKYDIAAQNLTRHTILQSDILENIPKKIKPDFESMAFDDRYFYVLGSGSTDKRTTMSWVSRETLQLEKSTDVSELYEMMRSFAGISESDFNIEGLVIKGDTWYFLQRGNGIAARNGIFSVKGNIETLELSILFNDYELPRTNGIAAGFTDGVISGDILYFRAATEDSASTYLDGEVLGSYIGQIDLKTMKLTATQKINAMHKFEGIAVYSESEKEISFVLCEDNDSHALKSDIFKLTLPK